MRIDMGCNYIQSLIDGYFDGELDLVKSLEIEQHIKECKNCSILYHNHNTLHKTLKSESFYFYTPQSLEDKVKLALNKPQKKSAYWMNIILNWRNATVGFAILAIISFSLLIVQKKNSGNEQLLEQIVNSHLRSLISNNLTDVSSSDKHTVKPWFDGKIDFSPPVVDLYENGFPLNGGRLDYIENRPVAVLVYHHKKHIINLFISLSDKEKNTQEKIFNRKGYNLIHWEEQGINFWAISDLSLNELKEFTKKLNTAL